jgi:hypothetical protein
MFGTPVICKVYRFLPLKAMTPPKRIDTKAYYPNPTSRAIIRAKPNISPRVAM